MHSRLVWALTAILAVSFSGDAFAKKSKKRNKKILTKEKTYKVRKGSKTTNLDFEAADISGARKTPLGTFVQNQGADKDYGFVKIRTKWHPEMVRSAFSLDVSGSSR